MAQLPMVDEHKESDINTDAKKSKTGDVENDMADYLSMNTTQSQNNATETNQTISSQQKKHSKPCGVKYTHLIISIMIIFMILFIVDRFTSNIWPLYFTKSSPIEHEFTATTFFIVGWIMGRELIIASSVIWLLQCRCFWNFIFEHKPNWLLVDDIMVENNHLHYHLGWFGIGVPMVVHIWLVFLPLLQSYKLHIYSAWMRPIDSETNFYIESVHHSTVHIAINDIYALLVSTVLFLALFPLSMHRKFRTKHWTLSQYMHIVAALLYGIELLRTPFTAHCWFISAPFIFCYVLDRFLGMFYYRTCHKAKIVHQYNIDQDYILVFMSIPGIYSTSSAIRGGTYREIGDCFWINTKQNAYRKFRPSHPFTTFYNHGSVISNKDVSELCQKQSLGDSHHKFVLHYKNMNKAVSKLTLSPSDSYKLYRTPTTKSPQIQDRAESLRITSSSIRASLSKTSQKENCNENEWNVGFLIAVHRRENGFSFTEYIRNTVDANHDMLTFGPYRSSFANVVNEIEAVDDNGQSAVVLIGTGGGASYIIDFMLYMRANMRQHPEFVVPKQVRVHFSCRSIKLFQWITDFLCEESIENVHVCAHLTSHKNVHDYDDAQNENKVRKAKIGRAAFDVFLRESPPFSKVFFCGSPFIQNKLKVLCKELQFEFFEGHTFG